MSVFATGVFDPNVFAVAGGGPASYPFEGAASASASTAADFRASRPLGGAATASSTASGALEGAAPNTLQGAAVAGSTASAAFGASKPLAGSASASSSATWIEPAQIIETTTYPNLGGQVSRRKRVRQAHDIYEGMRGAAWRHLSEPYQRALRSYSTGALSETIPDGDAVRWHAWQAYDAATFAGLEAEAARVAANRATEALQRDRERREQEAAEAKQRALEAADEQRKADAVRLMELQAQAAAMTASWADEEEAAMVLLLA